MSRHQSVQPRPELVPTSALHHRDTELTDLAELPVKCAPSLPLLPRCWELRDDLTIYDATYVALAEILDVRLLTADGRLARTTGPRCPIDLVAAD